MIWVEEIARQLKVQAQEPERDPEEVIEVNPDDLADLKRETNQFLDNWRNSDCFSMGVGMKYAMQRLGLWDSEVDRK